MKRRIPLVRQSQATDCAAACLTMVLRFYGRHLSLEEVRQVMGVGRDGASALTILQAGRHFGLQGEGLKLDLEDLTDLEPGAILHWEFRHFVVFQGLTRGGVELADPAVGRWVATRERFRRSFTGVVVALEPGGAFQPTPRAPNPLWRHLRQVLSFPGLLAQVAVISILIQLLALGVPVLTGTLVDRVLPTKDVALLWLLGGGLLLMSLLHLITSLVRSHLLAYLRTFVDEQMTLRFMQHLIRLPFGFFQLRSAGDLMMRAGSHATIREVLTSTTLSAFIDGGLALIYLIAIMQMSPLLGLVALLLAALQGLVFLVYRGRYQDLMGDSLAAQANAQGSLVGLLGGMETLKSKGAEQRVLDHWARLFRSELAATNARSRLDATADALLGALRTATPIVTLFLGGFLVLRGTHSLGTMLALQALMGGFLAPIATLMPATFRLQMIQSHIERINDVLDAATEQDQRTVLPAHRLQGGITLEQISFRYGPLSPLVIQDVSVTIRPGQFVALVGRSGSGKSTLGRLLLGLYPPTAGRVLYDGADLTTLDLQSVRQQLGVVSQQPYLLGLSIRENLAIMNPALPMAAVREAARLAQIDADIAAMPMGYETVLGDAGTSLSGGQRQRVALAQALVGRPAILLLDEATSALDTITEARVQEALASLACTRIVIAQRLSTVRNADLILVLDEGRVVERGTHAELLAARGHYASLVGAGIA